ncbi:hypothetical protein JHK87_028248 [Glycine soja]|nr:hypothetical protein JHK87_028248 [Glycine soja]
MFDGVPDQFHQFITPRTSQPLHLPFPLHASGTPNTTFPSNFDPYNNPSHQLPLQPNNLLHPLHHKDEEKEENTTTVPMNFEIQRDQRQQLPELIDPWTTDEVLTLLRIRSSMESWFPELTWEHVSRKLAELGYKRSAEKCKEKFEEESRYFNNNINYAKNNNNSTSNYRFLSELEQLYHQQGSSGDHLEKMTQPPLQKQGRMDHHALELEEEEGDSRNVIVDASVTKIQSDEALAVEKITKDRKRKRSDRFEMFKGFCESIVHKMMTQQEEMHNKLLEDMMKRDEEKFTREEAWKKQEMEKMNKELEMMAREQAVAGDRQAKIIQILNKFSATTSSPASHTLKKVNTHISQNPNPSQTENPTLSVAQDTLIPSTSSTSTPAPDPPQNPSSCSLNSQNNNHINNNIPVEKNSILNKGSSSNEKDDVGRRWPKDEVLALINLRCTSVNNNNNNEEKEGNNKVPLWERISQGMSELRYKRSAKRCKEKWENINKYFRKTKDITKKRSLDSRTCPYFHQLSSLYNQGKLVLQSESHLNNTPPDQNPEQVKPDQTTQAHESSSQVGSGSGFSVQQQQVPSLDFDQF